MKNRNQPVLLICAILLLQLTAFTQSPPLQWVKKYGGSSVDIPNTITYTSDGGAVAAGYTQSKDGDVGNYTDREFWDLWLVKLDRCGNLQWQFSLGGSGYESARDVLQTADGGFLVLGETNSTDGGVAAGFGGTKDIWLLKLDRQGNLQWQKRIGGTGLDIGNQLLPLADGNFLIIASTTSNDGNITGNHGTSGYTDGALIKITPTGDILWSKCFGGSKNDELLDAVEINGRLYVCGYANSVDGDIPANQKNYDAWLLVADQQGIKITSKIFGGSQNDVAYAMTKGNDGTLTMAGYTTSDDGDVSGAKGSQDFWVFNISTEGQLNWQKVLGGSDAEYASSIVTDADGGYLVGGISYSTDNDIINAKGKGDFWLVKLNVSGNTEWKQNYGGSENDNLRFISYQPSLNEYWLAGDSESNNEELFDGHGDTDFAILKLKEPKKKIIDSAVCALSGFHAAPEMLKDICGYDSVFVTYKPIIVSSALDQLPKSDTIFEGQSYALPNSSLGNISWESHPTLSCFHCDNPVASPLATTIYTATLPLDQCTVSDHFTLVVLKDAVVRIPNAFTPNGDGRNDWFGPEGKTPGEFRMQIFNRYGELVFQGSGINTRWDGRYKGIDQNTGVFVYRISYKDILNINQQKKGTLTLIR